jgi:hypothetical protein
MKDLLVLLAHLLTTIAKLLGLGGAKAIDTFKIPRHAQAAEVSIAVYLAQKRKARTQRSFTGT